MSFSRRLNITLEIRNVDDLTTNFKPQDVDGPETQFFIPDIQRFYVWKLKKQADLVDSIMMNFPIPSIICNMDSRRRYGIHDGCQRMNTLWLYRNDKFRWNDKLFSQLSEAEQRHFLERNLYIVVTRQATDDELAEIFERLNAGVSLTDSDKLWGRKDRALVHHTIHTYRMNGALARVWGDTLMNNRKQLANDVGVVAGLATWNSNYFTTSYIRLSNILDLDDIPVDLITQRIQDGVAALVRLYSTVIELHPILAKKTLGTFRRLGYINAYFLKEWMDAVTAEEDLGLLYKKWVQMVCLCVTKVSAKDAKAALTTTGAQNLTSKKIEEVLKQVKEYLATAVIQETEEVEEETEEETDDE